MPGVNAASGFFLTAGGRGPGSFGPRKIGPAAGTENGRA